MPQAAELFKFSSSPATGSDRIARRMNKSLEMPDNGSPRFDDMLSKASQRPAPKPEENRPKSERESDTEETRDDAETQSTSRKSKSEKTSKPHNRKRAQPEDGDASKAEDADQSAEKADPNAPVPATNPSSDDSEAQIDAEAAEAKPHAHEHSDTTTTAPNSQAAAMAQQPACQPVNPDTQAKTDDESEATSDVEAVAKSATQHQPQLKKTTAAAPKEAGSSAEQATDPADSGNAAHTPATTTKSQRAGDRLAISRKDAKNVDDARPTGAAQKAEPTDPSNALPQTDAVQQLASLFDDADSSKQETKQVNDKETAATPDMTRFVTPTHTGPTHDSTVSAIPDSPQADVTPEARFAEENHEKIVSGVRGELLPNGGTMRLRLDPPELGTLQVSLHMRDGVVSAQFQTANGDAANLLSHTLGDLRSTLEAHGIVVDKLHVQQSPREESDSGTQQHGSQSRDQSYEQQQDGRREQQRKDMIQKMWDRLAGLAPIDLVA